MDLKIIPLEEAIERLRTGDHTHDVELSDIEKEIFIKSLQFEKPEAAIDMDTGELMFNFHNEDFEDDTFMANISDGPVF